MVKTSSMSLGGRRFDSDVGRVIPKTFKMVSVDSSLDTQHLRDRAWINPVGWLAWGGGNISLVSPQIVSLWITTSGLPSMYKYVIDRECVVHRNFLQVFFLSVLRIF